MKGNVRCKKRMASCPGITCLLFVPRLVFAVDFDILSYKGDLNIHADNTAVFKKQSPTTLKMILMVN